MVTPDGKWITFDGGESFSLVPGYTPPEPPSDDLIDASHMAQERDLLTGLLSWGNWPNPESTFQIATPWLLPLPPDAAVLVLDIDHLLAINGTHGHPFGDRLLVEIAHRVQRVAADSPVWRHGDEFMIATRISRVDDLQRLARDLRIAIEEPFDGVSVSVGMGAAIASPGSIRASDLMRKAGEAMYHAKRQRTRELVIAAHE
jgi:diguanylate cyclase (GGDEF)-like protein